MSGAGFVLYRIFPDGIKFLGLVGPDFQQARCKGKYDIPKGVIDKGESSFETAIREAEEEAGYKITGNVIHGGPFKDGVLSIWLAQVFKDPIINPNPETGIIEHSGYEWLSPGDLLNNCYNYLVPSVTWAKGVIDERKF